MRWGGGGLRSRGCGVSPELLRGGGNEGEVAPAPAPVTGWGLHLPEKSSVSTLQNITPPRPSALAHRVWSKRSF